MTWVLWTLVPMVQAPRGLSGATFAKVLAQSECGQFCLSGICGTNWDCHHAKWHADAWGPIAWKSPLDSWWMAYGMADLIFKLAWRYTIGSIPEFWLIQIHFVHSDIGPRSCLLSCGPLALPWPGEPHVGMTPILVTLAS